MISNVNRPKDVSSASSQNVEAQRNSFEKSIAASSQNAPLKASSAPPAKTPSYYNSNTGYGAASFTLGASEHQYSNQLPSHSVVIHADPVDVGQKSFSKTKVALGLGLVLGVGGIVGGVAGSYAMNEENKDRPPGSGK